MVYSQLKDWQAAIYFSYTKTEQDNIICSRCYFLKYRLNGKTELCQLTPFSILLTFYRMIKHDTILLYFSYIL